MESFRKKKYKKKVTFTYTRYKIKFPKKWQKQFNKSRAHGS